MNKHLLLALLFIPMAACGDANADTVGSGSDVTLKRYIIQGDDFPPNLDRIERSPGKFDEGPFDPLIIPVPAGSQVIKSEWVGDDTCAAGDFPRSSVADINSAAAEVYITCDSDLRISGNRGGYIGHYSIIIAY